MAIRFIDSDYCSNNYVFNHWDCLRLYCAGIMEGIATKKALEGISRQPDAANDLRTTLLISMALLESTAIYVLLVILILIFANPLLDRFFM